MTPSSPLSPETLAACLEKLECEITDTQTTLKRVGSKLWLSCIFKSDKEDIALFKEECRLYLREKGYHTISSTQEDDGAYAVVVHSTKVIESKLGLGPDELSCLVQLVMKV